jgi:hypothetical protein
MSRIGIKFKQSVFNIEIDFDHTVNELFSYLEDVVDIDGLKCRLLLGGKSFIHSRKENETDDSPVLKSFVKPGAIGLLLASTSQEVEAITRFKPDPLLKGLDEEARAHERRVARTLELQNESPWGAGAKQDDEYRFERFEVLFKRLDPPPFEAEKLLRKLAIDPAIVSIMKSRKFKVNTLCELDPIDADVEQAQKGEGDKCLLGWNRNHGERIALRLRTNELTSFRKYDSIITTLIHELVHNVYGEHNDSFWSLFNELHEEYRHFHRGRNSAPSVGPAMAPLKSKSSTNIPEANVASKPAQTGFKKPRTAEELRDARMAALSRKPPGKQML